MTIQQDLENLPADSLDQEDESQPICYRTICTEAVMALAFGVFSLMTIFGWFFWTVPTFAVYLGVRALKKIDRYAGEYTGVGFAKSGIVVALLFGVVGHFVDRYIQQNSVPMGYKAIRFEDLQPKSSNEIIPQSAYDLEPTDVDKERRVYIKGFIYPGKRTVNIREFILVPTLAHCQFCPSNVKSSEMITVRLLNDMQLNYTNNEIAIGGKFRIDREQLTNPFGGLPYQIEADNLRD